MNICIFGATGLIGNHLLLEALSDPRVQSVKIFVRRTVDLHHSKLTQIVTTLHSLDEVAAHITGDVVFNCLGTTLRQAGSEAAQYAIDCEYPVRVAQIAAKNGVPCMVNVSSVGASASGNFYLKTKADMEEGVGKAIKNAYFVRPSLLVGDRKEFRLGERIGFWAMTFLNWLMVGGLRKYRSIEALQVAKAMLALAHELPKQPRVLHFDEIMQYSRRLR